MDEGGMSDDRAGSGGVPGTPTVYIAGAGLTLATGTVVIVGGGCCCCWLIEELVVPGGR